MNAAKKEKNFLSTEQKDEEIRRKLRALTFPNGDLDDLIFFKIDLKNAPPQK